METIGDLAAAAGVAAQPDGTSENGEDNAD